MKMIKSSIKSYMNWIMDIYNNFKKLLKRNDISRWKNVENETYKWDERNIMIASFIPEGLSVLDIGAGAQTLKRHLKGNKYVPCDIVQHPDTLYCDLNNNIFPKIIEKFDYVICSGVIEYLINSYEVVQKLPDFGRNIIISYAHFYEGHKKEDRLASGWKNHFTKKQIEEIFRKAKISWEILGYWNYQIIYLL